MIKKMKEHQLKRLDKSLAKTIAKIGEKEALKRFIKYCKNMQTFIPICFSLLVISSLANGFIQLRNYLSLKNTFDLVLMIISFTTAIISLLLVLFSFISRPVWKEKAKELSNRLEELEDN